MKNAFTTEQFETLSRSFQASLYDYHHIWHNRYLKHKSDPTEHNRTRFVLAARQIGINFYIAREALLDAITTGRNQIIIGESKIQARTTRDAMHEWVYHLTGSLLKGDPLKLSNGAEIHFTGYRANDGASVRGNAYVIDFAWMREPERARIYADKRSPDARFHKTFMTCPREVGSPAHSYWNGSNVDLSHDTLKHGNTGADGVWRHIVTAEDAIGGGFGLFDLDHLKGEFSTEDFNQMFMCKWKGDEDV